MNKNKKNDGSSLEKAVEKIYNYLLHYVPSKEIQRNVKMDTLFAPRQIDVLVTLIFNGRPIKIVIEAKDHNRKIDIHHIDAFVSKITDLEASKGVFVSKLGFTKSAKLKAKHFNIDLFSLQDSKDIPQDIKIPVLVEQVHPASVEFSFEVKRTEIQQLSAFSFHKRLVVNDVDIFDVFNSEWKDSLINYEMTTEMQTVHLSTLDGPFLLTGFANGNKKLRHTVGIEYLRFDMNLNIKYFVLDIRDLIHNKFMTDIHTENLQFFIDPESMENALGKLIPVTDEYAKTFKGFKMRVRLHQEIPFRIGNSKILLH